MAIGRWITKTAVAVGLAMGLFVGVAWAAPAADTAKTIKTVKADSTAKTAESPDKIVRSVANQMISELKRNKGRLKNHNVIHRIVRRVVLPHVAVDRMAAVTVGRRYWKSATPAQQQQFIKEFTRAVVNTYAAAMEAFNDERVKVYPLRGGYAKKRAVAIRSIIIRPGKQPVKLGYKLLRSGGTWKIYDFVVEGVSILRSYRAQFSRTLASSGLSGLIRKLARHNNKNESR